MKYACNHHCCVIVNNIFQEFYQGAVGVFVVYDITDKASLDHCQKWKKDIDKKVQLRSGDPIPTVLIANKVLYRIIATDNLSISTQIDIKKKHYDGEHLIKELDFARYYKTSARTGEGIRDAIHFMLQKVSSWLSIT